MSCASVLLSMRHRTSLQKETEIILACLFTGILLLFPVALKIRGTTPNDVELRVDPYPTTLSVRA